MMKHGLSATLGTLFLVTGWLKGVDPYGTSLKLQEYFHWFGWDGLQDAGMCVAILLCAGEIMLGLMLLSGAFRRATAWSVFVIVLLFTCLTGYMVVASGDTGIRECGCFGDAYTLSNPATFGKNIVLLLLSGSYLWLVRKSPAARNKSEWWLSLYWMAFALAVPLYSAVNLPPFDFLPYNRGTDLRDNPDFSVFSADYTDATDSLLGGSTDRMLLIVAQRDFTPKENRLVQTLHDSGTTEAHILAPAKPGKTFGIDFFYADRVTLKSLVRNETGIVLVDCGRIVGKWKMNRFPIEKYINRKWEEIATREKLLAPCYWGAIALALLFGGVMTWRCRKSADLERSDNLSGGNK